MTKHLHVVPDAESGAAHPPVVQNDDLSDPALNVEEKKASAFVWALHQLDQTFGDPSRGWFVK